MDFGRVLETVAEVCERTGLRYAVIGAFGLHAYGLSRGTFDLDFVAEAAAQSRLVAFFESLGYEPLHVPPDIRTTSTRWTRWGASTSCTLAKIQAMKNDPRHTLGQMEDIRFILTLPGIDEREIRGYFERAGVLDHYDELKRLG